MREAQPAWGLFAEEGERQRPGVTGLREEPSTTSQLAESRCEGERAVQCRGQRLTRTCLRRRRAGGGEGAGAPGRGGGGEQKPRGPSSITGKQRTTAALTAHAGCEGWVLGARGQLRMKPVPEPQKEWFTHIHTHTQAWVCSGIIPSLLRPSSGPEGEELEKEEAALHSSMEIGTGGQGQGPEQGTCAFLPHVVSAQGRLPLTLAGCLLLH